MAIPGIPVTPIPVIPTFIRTTKPPPSAPPIAAAINGFTSLRFTPKIAASVIPRRQENEAGAATAFSYLLFVIIESARAAPP